MNIFKRATELGSNK